MQNGKIKLFGSSYTISELTEYVADLSAIAGVKPYTLFEGPEKGVLAGDVWPISSPEIRT